MKQQYEVTGAYPVRRPLPLGTVISLTEEAARYHVLDGALRIAAAPADEATAEPVVSKRRGGSK